MVLKKKHDSYFVPLLASAFFVVGSYGLCRPAIESAFLEKFGAQQLPFAWLIIAAVSGTTAAIHAYFSKRFALAKVFQWSVLLSGLTLTGLWLLWVLFDSRIIFAIYVWKDIYSVILVESLWATANAHFRVDAAKKRYGLLCVAGSTGGVVGGFSIGFVAQWIGTQSASLIVLPALVAAFAFTKQLPIVPPQETENDEQKEGRSIFRNLAYMPWIALLVAAVQFATAAIDYRYNQVLENAFPDVDARTTINGRLYTAIDFISLLGQLSAARLLHSFGVVRTLISIPIATSLFVVATVAYPRFATFAACKIAIKALVYSWFRPAKEILYIPLQTRVKNAGKVLIDVFGYRSAKAVASLMLWALVDSSPNWTYLFPVIAALLCWWWVMLIIRPRFQRMAKES